MQVSVECSPPPPPQLQPQVCLTSHKSRYETVSMENCKYKAAATVKSEQRPRHRAKHDWHSPGGYTLTSISSPVCPPSTILSFSLSQCWNIALLWQPVRVSLFFLRLLSYLQVSRGRLRGPTSKTCSTQSMALRWTIGCRSRNLCWGNVCLCDWTVPQVYVNWAPYNHTQTRMISVCPTWKRRQEIILSPGCSIWWQKSK